MSKTEVARQCLATKKQGKKLNIAKKIISMTRAKLSHVLNTQNSVTPPPTPQRFDFVGIPHHIPEKKKNFFEEIFNNFFTKPTKRKWSFSFIGICLLILFTNRKCYEILTEVLVLPSISTIYRLSNDKIPLQGELITNISNLERLCSDYRKKLQISNYSVINGFLAVDALSLDPFIEINMDGKIDGITNSIFINEELKLKIKDNIKEQENLIKTLRNITINSAFVYQFQPVDPRYSPFVVHIMSSNSSKATQKQVDLLYYISLILKEYKFKVIGYASDGDSAYNILANQYMD